MKYFSRAEVERIGKAGVYAEETDFSIKARVLSSFWLHCEKDDTAFTPWMKTDGYWESWITCWFSQQLDSNGIFFDIGANVGYYAFIAAKHGLRVDAFEPNPRLVQLFEASSIDNRVWDHVYLNNHCLGNSDGRVNLFIPQGHSGAASMYGGGDRVEVDIKTLDNCNKLFGRNIIAKIDAEGAEFEILAGATKTMKHNDVTWFIEWQRERFADGKFAKYLFDNFKVSVIQTDGTELKIGRDYIENTDELLMIVLRKNT